MAEGHRSGQARTRVDAGAARVRLLELMLAKERGRIESQPPRSGPIPLSYEQERLWFIERLGLAGSAYNLSLGLRLKGKLSEVALREALTSLVSRHAVLRTRFEMCGAHPAQSVEPLRDFPVHKHDIAHLIDATERELQLKQLMEQEQEHRFDLGTAPLLRATLVRLAAEEHALLLTVHHIVSDGWSLELMLTELAMVYSRCVEGATEALPALPMQYADYAIWQRHQFDQGSPQRHLEYWRRQLSGAPPLLELPSDRPRPAQESFKGGERAVFLSAALIGRLRALAYDQGATLFMVLLAAYQILLSRWSRQRDIVVGTPVAIRPREEIENLIGNFVNTLALRTEIDEDLTFRQLLGRVKDVALGAYAHQEMQFDALVAELRPDRSLTAHPIFQVTIVMQNYPSRRLQLRDLSWEPIEFESTTTHFDLTLGLEEVEGGIAARFVHAVDLFDSQTVGRMSQQFARLLESIVASPDAPVRRLRMLPSEEMDLLLEDWNAAALEQPEERRVHDLFSAQALRSPDAVALRQGHKQLSYRELDQQSNQLARYLRDRGVGPDQIVALCMRRSVELVVGMLGVLKAGAAYLPLDPGQPEERLRFILRDAGVSVLLSNAEMASGLLDCAAEVVYVDRDAGRIAAQSIRPVAVETDSSNLAYLIYTSGSTGLPKGVMVQHGGLSNYLRWALRRYQPESGAAIPISSPLSFDATATALYCALLSGRSALLLQDGGELEELSRQLQQPEPRLSLIKVSPAHLQAIGPALQSARPPCGLNSVVVGGEALPARTVELWRSFWPDVRIFNQYGPTETVIACCVHQVPNRPCSGTVPIGRPADNVSAYVLDSNLTPVPIGVVGELYIAGNQLGRGYVRRPGMTADRFLANPFGPPGTRMYRTGDLVRYRADANLEFVGRIDRQVKVRGYRIELNEIEASLLKYPGITHAVVIVKEVAAGDVRLIAYVGCKDGGATVVELRSHLQSQLPQYMVPNAIVSLERLPLTANGKVDLRALPAPDASAYAAREYEPAQGELEQALVEIWQDCIGVARIGRHDNFFELGGHSLLGLKLAAQISERLSVQLSAIAVFRHPTILEMARAVASARVQQERSAEEILEEGGVSAQVAQSAKPLSFSQLAHYRMYQLGSRSAIRQIASATRLSGDLEVDALRASIDGAIQRHDSLRTLFRPHGSEIVQEIVASAECMLEVQDLSSLDTRSRELEMRRAIDRLILQPVDVAIGPLFGARLLRLASDQHVLIMAMEHLISDAVSMQILLREILISYAQRVRGRAVSLPAVQTQFHEFAARQRAGLREWLRSHGPYWQRHLQGSEPLTFPPDPSVGSASEGKWRTATIELDAGLTCSLRQWCRRTRTTLPMAILSAYVALLLRWCNKQDAIVQFESSGRISADFANTIGYFASPLFLRVRPGGNRSFEELVGEVTAEYCAAYEHADLSYLISQVPQPTFARTTLFNWVPRPEEASSDQQPDHGLVVSPISFAHPIVDRFELDGEPTMLVHEFDTAIQAVLYYPGRRFSAATMEDFCARFLTFIRKVTQEPI